MMMKLRTINHTVVFLNFVRLTLDSTFSLNLLSINALTVFPVLLEKLRAYRLETVLF